MKDIYYSRPILYDYVISIIIIVFLIIMELKGKIIIPCSTKSSDFASDLGAIGLTVSGFILTLITILLEKTVKLTTQFQTKMTTYFGAN